MWPVNNLIPLIGWNYSVQTWENILTNESTWMRNRSHLAWATTRRAGGAPDTLILNLTIIRNVEEKVFSFMYIQYS